MSGRGFPGNYELKPTVPLPSGHRLLSDASLWDAVGGLADERAGRRPLILVDTYPGVHVAGWRDLLARRFPSAEVWDFEDATAKSTEELQALFAPNLTEDRVFGVMGHHRIDDIIDPVRLAACAERARSRSGPVVVVGWGAGLLARDEAVVVSVELARWEIQQRYRAGAANWRADNGDEDTLRKIKRGYFVEWRIADRHKQDTLFGRADFIVDGNRPAGEGRALSGEGFHAAMDAVVSTPFRVVPYFDPGVWGGQWMRAALGLPDGPPNYAWAFDCVPEENSVLISASGHVLELPAIDVVLTRPRELLGPRTHARFGPEFPIRFDFLDTMGGGNLSLQVHPLTGYIRDRFGMAYTQDESYYLLDVGEDASVYLGVRTGTDPEEFAAALTRAQSGGEPLPVEKFINRLPAAKHDHFSIPAGTVHCSGVNALVLEISATPYLFTFKLWDWGRLGLDGRPRPIHLDHGLRNIQWERDTEWVPALHVVDPVAAGDGWREERTGLHELEFLEVRRHWFTGPVEHDTGGTVNVLNLVEGDEVEIVSPGGAFEPFRVHYAETFIVPAAVGPYLIRPTADAAAAEFATIKAYVRGTHSRSGGEP